VLLLAALLSFLLAAGSLLGVVVHLTEQHSLGCIALGLAFYMLALQPKLPPPRP